MLVEEGVAEDNEVFWFFSLCITFYNEVLPMCKRKITIHGIRMQLVTFIEGTS